MEVSCSIHARGTEMLPMIWSCDQVDIWLRSQNCRAGKQQQPASLMHVDVSTTASFSSRAVPAANQQCCVASRLHVKVLNYFNEAWSQVEALSAAPAIYAELPTQASQPQLGLICTIYVASGAILDMIMPCDDALCICSSARRWQVTCCVT